jgi:PTS system mannose-specific IID component
MQNMGFLFVIKPFIDSFYKDKEDRKNAFLRHCEHFNTHPYMANIIIPLCANAEKSLRNGNSRALDEIHFYKTAMAGSLAAVGDSFFWGAFRTCSALISIAITIVAVLIGHSRSPLNLIIPFVFLFIFNAFHLPIRAWFLFIGFSVKETSIKLISKLQFKFLLRLMKIFASLFTIVLSAFYAAYFKGSIISLGSPIFDIIAAAFLFFAAILLGRCAPIIKLYGFTAIAVLISLAGF